MGKFKPIKFGASVGIIGFVVVLLVGFSIIDEGLALEFLPPELRFVGGCFRNCIDEDQTGFGGQDPSGTDTIIDEEITIVETDPITNETIECDGFVTIHGQVVIDDPSCEGLGDDSTTTPSCPDGQMIGIDGKCKIITIVTQDGAEFTLISIDETVACWMNVNAKIINAEGFVIGSEQSIFFMVNPVPQLSLTDTKSGKDFSGGTYELSPMLKCTTNDEGGLSEEDKELFNTLPPFVYPSFDTPMKLEATELQFRIYSVFGDRLLDTYNAPITIAEQEITNPMSIDLGEHTIRTIDLIKFLPEGDYNSFQHIALEGELVVHWNTGDPTVDNVPQIITLKTEKTFTDGRLTQVDNPVMIFRELIVSKDVTGTEPPVMMDCPDGEVPINPESTVCIPIGDDGCGDNQTRINGFCVTFGTDDESTNPSVENIVDRFITCLSSGDPNCYLSNEFLPSYLIGVGVVVVAVGVGQRATKQPDIYGIPRGF